MYVYILIYNNIKLSGYFTPVQHNNIYYYQSNHKYNYSWVLYYKTQ